MRSTSCVVAVAAVTCTEAFVLTPRMSSDVMTPFRAGNALKVRQGCPPPRRGPPVSSVPISRLAPLSSLLIVHILIGSLVSRGKPLASLDSPSAESSQVPLRRLLGVRFLYRTRGSLRGAIGQGMPHGSRDDEADIAPAARRTSAWAHGHSRPSPPCLASTHLSRTGDLRTGQLRRRPRVEGCEGDVGGGRHAHRHRLRP